MTGTMAGKDRRWIAPSEDRVLHKGIILLIQYIAYLGHDACAMSLLKIGGRMERI